MASASGKLANGIVGGANVLSPAKGSSTGVGPMHHDKDNGQDRNDKDEYEKERKPRERKAEARRCIAEDEAVVGPVCVEIEVIEIEDVLTTD